jgi:deoxyribonuclease IV
VTETAPAEQRLAALGGRRMGPHLQHGGRLVQAADRAAALGATAVQIFNDNPTAWRRRVEPAAKVEAFRSSLHDHDIKPLAVHGPYLINLAGGNERFWERSVETLSNDLLMAGRYGAGVVTIHIGSHRGLERVEGIARVAQGIRAALERADLEGAEAADSDGRLPALALENAAGGGETVGVTLEELAEIRAAIEGVGVPEGRVGFCLDTAHLWGAGYEISRPEVVDDVLARFDELLGGAALLLMHLNDSRALLGSRADRHEHLGAGRIGQEGLGAVVRHPRLAAVPMLFETPGMDEGYDAVNMERARLLLGAEPLPELPPEAFALRRARSRPAGPRSRRAPSPEGT